jgi:uncharacterized C2H2 Zn-finger protein
LKFRIENKMSSTLLTCITCNDIFRSRPELNYHVRREHQSSVKIKYQNGVVAEVKRGEDNTFKCKCGKSVALPDSLQKHAKRCNDESMELEENEDEAMLMDVDDSSASESVNAEDRMIPADCFGMRISHEKANCRG